jgi:hypothetical protein
MAKTFSDYGEVVEADLEPDFSNFAPNPRAEEGNAKIVRMPYHEFQRILAEIDELGALGSIFEEFNDR